MAPTNQATNPLHSSLPALFVFLINGPYSCCIISIALVLGNGSIWWRNSALLKHKALVDDWEKRGFCIGWLVGWVVSLLVCWFVSSLVYWLVGWMVGWLGCALVRIRSLSAGASVTLPCAQQRIIPMRRGDGYRFIFQTSSHSIGQNLPSYFLTQVCLVPNPLLPGSSTKRDGDGEWEFITMSSRDNESWCRNWHGEKRRALKQANKAHK